MLTAFGHRKLNLQLSMLAMHDDEGVSESRLRYCYWIQKHVEIIQPVQSIARHNRAELVVRLMSRARSCPMEIAEIPWWV